MSESAQIRVAASNDALLRALGEQKRHVAAWDIAALDPSGEPLGADAIVIVDFDDHALRDGALDALAVRGFSGPVLVLGDADEGRPDIESVPRPVRLGLLLNRLAAYAAGVADPAAMRLGPYDFFPSDRLLRHGANAEEVRLTELEQRLLDYLAAAGGLVERERLLEQVWGYHSGADTHTVETHIWRLRQKIETDDPATRFLVTEAGGYRLIVGETNETA